MINFCHRKRLAFQDPLKFREFTGNLVDMICGQEYTKEGLGRMLH